MPTLTFILPHWLYWAGLLLFPLLAAYLVRRQLRTPPHSRPKLFIAYLFWLTAGFIGIHRFYLRSAVGFAFIPVFLFIIFCNDQLREVRDDTSRTYAAYEQAQHAAEVAKPDTPTPTPEASASYKRAQDDLAKTKSEFDVALAVTNAWYGRARWGAIVLAIMLLVDAVLLPGLVRRQGAREMADPHRPLVADVAPATVAEPVLAEDPTLHFHTRVSDWIEAINVRAGEFVAWWSLIAVFVYYYEVVARYVFNSPTNWVHESMFLMFGMQYMLSGAYAYREDQHVRVDVIYAKFSPRGKAIADIVTSVFFFIFIGTMFVTGIRFAGDAIRAGEVSFTEWGIQYWPVKLMIPIGAGLLLLQGLAKLLKDVLFVARRGA
ncbi:MAG TPA: TRAP transporter small permease subunit [Casimicrobiaceae bacterium]|nr:TRAP transporter small permease subunit [Casimicrobiaceae bacterium]